MSRGSREKAIQLTFATLPCQRCGEQRILAQSCSSCGMKPRAGEVNHHVQRRRQLVADALAKLSAPPQQSTPQEIHLLSREAGTVFPQIQSALRRGAADGVSGAELALALDRINRLVASTSTPQLRPMSTIGRRLHEATTLLKSAVNVYLDAFVAPTLREAQDLARTGQDRLDDAAAKAADFADALDRQDRLSSASVDDALDIMAALLASTDEGSVLALDVRGERLARSVIPADEPLVGGSGLTASWVDIYVVPFLDSEAFTLKAQRTYAAMRWHPRLADLAHSPSWRKNHERASRVMLDSSHALEALLAGARHDLASARAILLFIQDVTEGAQKHLLATLLDVSTGRPYDRMMRRDAADLIQQAIQGIKSPAITRSTTKALRNASAHNSFRVHDDAITLSPGPHETTLTADEFGDAVLAAVEDILALQLALALSLNQGDLEDTPPDPELSIRILLAASGLRNATVGHDLDCLTIRAQGDLHDPVPLLGAILGIYGKATRCVTVVTERADGEITTLTADPQPFLAHAATDERDTVLRQLHFSEGCLAATINGKPIIELSTYRHAIAIYAGQALQEAHPIPSLRTLRRSAERTGDLHLVQLLTSLMRASRLLAAKQPLDPPTQQALDELATLESTPIAKPFNI